MTNKIRHIVVIVCLLGFFKDALSQSIYVRASIDKNAILIGEPIRLELEARLPEGNNAKWFQPDSIPHFEFMEQTKIDTVKSNGGSTFKQTVTITSFDSGQWVIPAMSLELNGMYYLTDSMAVDVQFSNFDPSKDYHDIKDILPVEDLRTDYVNWILATVTLLALIGLIYFLSKKKTAVPRSSEKPGPDLSPVDEALRALEELKSRQLPENGQVKLYYTGLNDILRVFIMKKLSAASLQKTNEELLFLVSEKGLSNEAYIVLAQTLRMSDAVKFAKYLPAKSDNDDSLRHIKTSIELLNNVKN